MTDFELRLVCNSFGMMLCSAAVVGAAHFLEAIGKERPAIEMDRPGGGGASLIARLPEAARVVLCKIDSEEIFADCGWGTGRSKAAGAA